MEWKENMLADNESNSMKDDGETSGYAPRSPDLSSFYSDSPTQAAAAAPQVEQSSTGLPVHQARYKLRSPSCSYSPYSADSNPYSYAQHARHTRHTQQTPGSAPHSHQHPNPNLELHPAQARPQYRSLASQPSPASARSGYDYSTYAAPQSHAAPGQHRPYSSPRPGDGLQNTNSPPFPTREQQRLAKSSTAESSAFATPTSFSSASSSFIMPPRKAAAPPPPPPAVEPSPVKTKFPTARIKRIMQADEEVGKVAQQTPIAVGKALELFMIQLVSKSADVAKEKGSKRVTASMLKQVVETDEQWDFLRDIVSRVENEKEASKAKAKESESDEEMEEPKKRGRGGGRRKKSAV